MKPRFLFLLTLLCVSAQAQVDSLSPPAFQEDLLESYLQSQETSEEFEFNDLFSDIQYLRKHTIDINRISIAELEHFFFLSPIQKKHCCIICRSSALWFPFTNCKPFRILIYRL